MRKFIVPYLFFLVLLTVFVSLSIYYKWWVNLNFPGLEIYVYCSLLGVIGGVVQCLRGVYLHIKNWDDSWNIWYYVRPVVSGIFGFISLILIKAGLLVFQAQSTDVNTNAIMAYYAIAFIAGYNVQNFITKLEEISKTVLGIEKGSQDKASG